MKVLPAQFEGQDIRRVYDEVTDIWRFAVIDVVQVLTQQPDDPTARKYWNQLKRRLDKEGIDPALKAAGELARPDCRTTAASTSPCVIRRQFFARNGRFARNERIAYTRRTHHPQEPAMQTYTANEAKTRFGEFLDRVQREPVRVMRHDRVVGVMVSAEDYEAMRAFYANRLAQTMNETAQTAQQAGLTPELLAKLLADES